MNNKLSEHINVEILGEHFVSEHTFFYIQKGATICFDGNSKSDFKSGAFGLIRKNRLAKYVKEKGSADNKTIFILFDERFLKAFQEKYHCEATAYQSEHTFIKLNPDEVLAGFIPSLLLYYAHDERKIKVPFGDVKREELLLILLELQPDLAGVFFDYGIPQKINLEEFMNKNFKFNVSINRFAFLTGRSLSAFKRDFKTIFNDRPSHWLVKKRLQEAYFLIEKKKSRPSDIYLELGFETLSHFSFSFKKQFGLTPTELADQKKKINL